MQVSMCVCLYSQSMYIRECMYFFNSSNCIRLNQPKEIFCWTRRYDNHMPKHDLKSSPLIQIRSFNISCFIKTVNTLYRLLTFQDWNVYTCMRSLHYIANAFLPCDLQSSNTRAPNPTTITCPPKKRRLVSDKQLMYCLGDTD